ncbi:hypothetical protein CK516_20095, partial [Nostoc sp. 'Peltigera malacea cyanobiont' DB3992]
PYSPSGILRQALASPFGRRGDATRTSRETRPTHCLPNALASLVALGSKIQSLSDCGGEEWKWGSKNKLHIALGDF